MKPVIVAILGAAAAAVAMLGTTHEASAAVTLKLYNQDWSPSDPTTQGLTLLYNNPGLLEPQVDAAWAANSHYACEGLKNVIESPIEYDNDEYRGYDTVCSMAASGTLSIGGAGGFDSDGNPNVVFTYKTSGYVEFTATQPYVDKWGDPRFSLTFDLAITYVVDIARGGPNAGQPMPAISLVNASATVSNLKVDTHGVIADAVKSAVDLYEGSSFISSALASIDNMRVHVPVAAANLDALNAALADNLNGRRITGAFGVAGSDEDQLILIVTDAWQQTPGNTVIAEVSWDTAGIGGVNSCKVFDFVGEIQTGPAPIMNWATKETGAPPLFQVEASQSYAPAQYADGTTKCQSTILNLPTSLPVKVMPTAGVGGDVGQFAGVVKDLSPPSSTVLSGKSVYAHFVLKTKIKPGTGVSVVKTKPKVNGGDPAPVVTQTKPGNDISNQIDLSKIFGQQAAPAQQAPVVTAPATSASKFNLNRKLLLKGITNQNAAPNLNPTLH